MHACLRVCIRVCICACVKGSLETYFKHFIFLPLYTLLSLQLGNTYSFPSHLDTSGTTARKTIEIATHIFMYIIILFLQVKMFNDEIFVFVGIIEVLYVRVLTVILLLTYSTCCN